MQLIAHSRHFALKTSVECGVTVERRAKTPFSHVFRHDVVLHNATGQALLMPNELSTVVYITKPPSETSVVISLSELTRVFSTTLLAHWAFALTLAHFLHFTCLNRISRDT